MAAVNRVNPITEPLLGADSQADQNAPSKVVDLAQRTLDAKGNPIWTHQDFNWAARNPFATAFTRGNDYVTEQWSEEYFTASKAAVGLAKDAIKNVGRSLARCDFGDAGKHLVNFLALAAKLAVNIEIANFIKGLIGVVLSAGKAVFHPVACFVCLLAMGALVFFDKEKAKELFIEALANFGFFFKDLVSIVSCFGHAIPSWLPLVIMCICPPAGLALQLVKTASKFTGIFDVMAYGGTAVLLYTKKKMADRDLQKDPTDKAALAAREAWEKLKRELNPTKSLEGATLAMYGLHVLAEGATTALDFFVPGASKLAEYASYGIQAAVGVGLAATVYKNTRKPETEMSTASPATVTEADALSDTESVA